MHNTFSKEDERVNKIVATINKMFGQQDMLIRRKSEIISEISEANEYLEHQDEVAEILHQLQDRAQAKTKLIYEELLTTLIHEVKGYDKENHKVVLNTRIKNNRPWLDVEVENADGIPRDVYLDKGGSIKSIVSMGLRFITLSRTTNRRVIFFDEPDKEINAKYADGIAKILYQLTKKIGMQVVYISHHDSSYFEGYARIIELSRMNKAIVTDIVSDIDEKKYEEIDDDVSEDLEGIGIRYIRLKNLKQHHNTIIELSQFVTVITGDNDIGKSSVMHAIDAINKNKGRDGLIRDNESYCMVELGLEDNTSLSWTYKRSGNKRTKYSLKDSENVEIQSSDSGTSPPEWLGQYLGMGLYKDFDLNMSDQNNTSFILDSKVSGHKRAEILSLGKETNQALAMIKEHNQRCESFRKKKYHLKKELNKVKNQLECYRHLYTAEEKINTIQASRRSAEQISRDLESMVLVTKRIIRLSSNLSILDEKIPNQFSMIEAPSYLEDKKLIDKLFYLREKHSVLERLINVCLPASPEFEDLSSIISIGAKLSKLGKLNQTLNKAQGLSIAKSPDVSSSSQDLLLINRLDLLKGRMDALSSLPERTVNAPDIDSSDDLVTMAIRIKELQNKALEISKEEISVQSELESISKEKQETIGDLNGECPICGSHIEGKGNQHEH